jgi:prepilin-type N-terminal cleavage/methylation domain-containing protein
MSGRRWRGFTLVELLVAMSIGMTLVVLLAQVSWSGQLAWERAATLSAQGSRELRAHDAVRRLVSGMMEPPAGIGAVALEANERSFEAFTSPSQGLRKAGPLRAQLAIREEAGRNLSLVLSLAPPDAPLTEHRAHASPLRIVLLSGLRAARIDYRYRVPGGLSAQRPGPQARPDLVIVSWNAGSDPALARSVAVRPRIDAAGECASDIARGPCAQ